MARTVPHREAPTAKVKLRPGIALKPVTMPLGTEAHRPVGIALVGQHHAPASTGGRLVAATSSSDPFGSVESGGVPDTSTHLGPQMNAMGMQASHPTTTTYGQTGAMQTGNPPAGLGPVASSNGGQHLGSTVGGHNVPTGGNAAAGVPGGAMPCFSATPPLAPVLSAVNVVMGINDDGQPWVNSMESPP